MTTEDDFQTALDTNPEDWQTRLVFADWLDDHGDPRAAGYRVMGERRLVPSTAKKHKHDNPLWSWSSTETGRSHNSTLRACWSRKLPSRPSEEVYPDLPNVFRGDRITAVPSRREAEDNAARAYAELTPAQQAQC